MSDLTFALLQKEEAIRTEPYRDSEGFWTVGYGHLIDRRAGGFLPPWIKPSFPLEAQECEELLRRDIELARIELTNVIDVRGFDEVRRTVFESMVFQLGRAKMLKFTNTLAAAREHDWEAVAKGIRNSLWYQQTPGRVERLARTIESGNVADLGVA